MCHKVFTDLSIGLTAPWNLLRRCANDLPVIRALTEELTETTWMKRSHAFYFNHTKTPGKIPKTTSCNIAELIS